MKIINVEDARALAKRRMPRIFFDYLDGGAFSENTLRLNQSDFNKWNLRQRVLNEHPPRDLSTSFLGERHKLPLMLGPVGFLGMFARKGELAAAKAAEAAGIAFCLSSFSNSSLADLREAVNGSLHFQLYVLKDRGLVEELIQNAKLAQVNALYVTVDTAVTSVRERDVRNGFRSMTKLSPSLLAKMALHPSWCIDMLRSGSFGVAAVANRPEFGKGVLAQAANLSRQIDQNLTWHDIAWLRARWPGRLVIKGILSTDDAIQCRDSGADAIVISNHGGRQLDCAPSTISVLPEISKVLDGKLDIMIDSGFRRGTDVVKALALGASGVMLGRAYAYGIGAAGQTGATAIVESIAQEIDTTLALMGLKSIDELKSLGAGVLTRSSLI